MPDAIDFRALPMNNAATKATKSSKVCYLLMTGLFYPAVLGTLFYAVMQAVTGPLRAKTDVLLLLCYIACLVSFSVDYLYTVSSKNEYGRLLFVSDIVILVLLYIAYSSLITSASNNQSPKTFFLAYTLIHSVFTIWDLSLIPRSRIDPTVLTYDLLGLGASLGCFIFFKNSLVAAYALLFALTLLYSWVGWNRIIRRCNEVL